MTFDAAQSLDFGPKWLNNPAEVPAPVNQFVFLQGLPLNGGGTAGDIVMVLGHATPPIVIPTPQGVLTPGIEDGLLPIAVHGTFSMTRERAREFSDILRNWLDQTDAEDAGRS